MTQPSPRIAISEEAVQLLDQARRFCAEKSPIDTVRVLLNDERGFDENIWSEIGALGWTAIAIDEEYGGIGLSLAETVPVMEAMGRAMMETPFYVTTLAAQALIAGASESQKQKYLPQIASGSAASLALSEPGGSWNLAEINASASGGGDTLQLSGKKVFVQHLPSAKFFITSVMIDGTPALVIIDAEQIPETAYRRETIIDETKRSYALTLDGITISPGQIMDPANMATAFSHIDIAANLLAAAEMAGGNDSVINYTLEYLNTRKQFGKYIGAYQALKHPIVDAFVEFEKARSHLYGAAASISPARSNDNSGEIAVRMAKAQADTAFSYAADRSIQFHGGFGFTYECDAQLYRRRAIWHASQFGDAAWQRQKLGALLF